MISLSLSDAFRERVMKEHGDVAIQSTGQRILFFSFFSLFFFKRGTIILMFETAFHI